MVSFQDEQFLLQKAQQTRKEPVGHGPRQDTAEGTGLLKGCFFVRLSRLLGFPESRGLGTPGVHAKLCPGISGVAFQHRPGLACGSHVAV